MRDDNEFCEFLLTRALVAGVAGSGFGAPGHLRLSFACGEETLKRALERIGEALRSPAP
jgi:aspartate aminotransferase